MVAGLIYGVCLRERYKVEQAKCQNFRVPAKQLAGEYRPHVQITRQGFEPNDVLPFVSSEKPTSAISHDAQDDARDPHLTAIVSAWSTLPEHIKDAIAALVQVNTKQAGNRKAA